MIIRMIEFRYQMVFLAIEKVMRPLTRDEEFDFRIPVEAIIYLEKHSLS